MAADLIIYAVIAAGLIFWLRGILGTRHGDERERPSPFTAAEGQDQKAKEQNEDMSLAPMTIEQKLNNLLNDKSAVGGIENKTAENALLDIMRTDKSLDIVFFLQAAQDSFVMGVEAFGAGDRETLKDLLSEKVYNVFEKEIATREEREEIQHVEIQAVRKAEIIEAKLDGKTACITVRFRVLEVSFTKNKEGAIISGHETKSTEMRDIWTFSRDLRSKDPRWLVSETRGGFEDDNDLIPNV